MIYKDNPGFITNEELIKHQAAEIDVLRKEVYESREMRQYYLGDIDRLMKENLSLMSGDSKESILETAVRSFEAVHNTNKQFGSPWVVFPFYFLFFALGVVIGVCI